MEAHRLAPDLVIVGEEIDTETGGELIAYFVKSRSRPVSSARGHSSPAGAGRGDQRLTSA